MFSSLSEIEILYNQTEYFVTSSILNRQVCWKSRPINIFPFLRYPLKLIGLKVVSHLWPWLSSRLEFWASVLYYNCSRRIGSPGHLVTSFVGCPSPFFYLRHFHRIPWFGNYWDKPLISTQFYQSKWLFFARYRLAYIQLHRSESSNRVTQFNHMIHLNFSIIISVLWLPAAVSKDSYSLLFPRDVCPPFYAHTLITLIWKMCLPTKFNTSKKESRNFVKIMEMLKLEKSLLTW